MFKKFFAGLAFVGLMVTPAFATMQASQSVADAWFLTSGDFSCSAIAFREAPKGVYLLTARHCVFEDEGQDPSDPLISDLEATQGGGKIGSALPVLWGADATQDWAVLYVPNLHSVLTAPIETVLPAYVDEPIVITGYPYGIGPITTRGLVTGVALTINGQMFFTVDAFAAPGNSGSGVVDSETGNVIGILVGAISDGQGGPWLEVVTPINEVPVLPDYPTTSERL